MPRPFQGNARVQTQHETSGDQPLASERSLLAKNGPPTERIEKRTHLSAFLSADEGRTWKDGLLLDERGFVSHPDGFASPDGLMHILYDGRIHGGGEMS